MRKQKLIGFLPNAKQHLTTTIYIHPYELYPHIWIFIAVYTHMYAVGSFVVSPFLVHLFTPLVYSMRGLGAHT